MLTRKGWLALFAALAFFVAGRLVGRPELYVLGSTIGLLVAGAAVYVRMTPLSIDVARELHPPRVHAGTPSRIDLRVRNLGRLRSPVLNLRDGVSGTHGANLIVPPLSADAVARAAYRLPTERRGIVDVGPLDVMLSDPFGLTTVTMQASGVSELTVYPHIDDVAPVPQTTGNDPMAGAEHPNALGRNGEDFYALRQYVVGDDLRRVHWPSTARHDELMVRQDELPWQGRATVLVDVRSATNTVESLELVISAAASIVTANARRQDLVRLVSTDGSDSGFAAGNAHVEAILEHLASVQATNEANYRRVVDRLARGSIGGALVVVVAMAPQTELEQIVRLRNRFGSLRIVQFDPSSWGSTGPVPSAPAREGVIHITAAKPFGAAWNAAVGGARRRDRSTATHTPGHDAESEPDRWDAHARLLR
jgi:uncharacterized protein (DUF58 family)